MKYDYDKYISNVIKTMPNTFRVDDKVTVVKGWISEDLCDKLVSWAESLDEEKWWEKNKREWYNGKFLFTADDKEIQDELDNLKKRLQELFMHELWIENMNSIHRMSKGEKMFEHADNLEESGLDNKCIFGLTQYISNFEGGGIYYPKANLDYKPEKGDLLIHPGSDRYTHGTDPVVGDKIRYIVAGFASLPEAQALREKDQMYEGIDAIKMSSAVTGIFGKNDLPEEFSQTIPFEYIEKH